MQQVRELTTTTNGPEVLDCRLDLEQLNVVNLIKKNKSISVNAVFGSGKTTTMIEAVKCNINKKCILVTYNTHLKNEVKRKVIDADIDLEVYTYHSLSMKFFGFGKNDEELQLQIDTPPKINLPAIDVLFIDEIQDMTLLLYTFIQKFIHYLPISPQIVICGDHLQGVYQFKGADKRFLTLGSSIFQIDFVECQMKTSYRLTNPMGWFINECIYGQQILKTVKEGLPILFFHQSMFTAVRSIIQVLKEKPNLLPQDIFVLAPSLKCGKRAPLKILENMIYEKLGFPIYYCTMEERELNDEVIQGKVVFSTFHQSKGRERKIVIVFGFDESYYQFYAKDEIKDQCPSTLIVALSRAKEELIIVKDVNKRPLPFVKKSILEMSNFQNEIKIIGQLCEVEINDRTTNTKPLNYKKIKVTDLVKYIKIEYQLVISDLKDKLFFKKCESVDHVNFKSFVEYDSLTEDISDLIGILVPSIFEEEQTGISKMKVNLIEGMNDPNLSEFVRDKIKNVKIDSVETNDLLYTIKVHKALDKGLYSPFQIRDNLWISEDEIQRILNNIRYHIQDKQLFEYELDEDTIHPVYYNHPDFGKIFVSGRIDSMDKNYVWEFKCVKDLTLEHFLQVVCYQWLWNLILKEQFQDRIFRLLNIRTGEMYEMKNDQVLVNDIIHLLMLNRYAKNIIISDKDFISSCLFAKKLSKRQ
jgi:hypothetical protein